jgi:hypothetical protein
MSDEILRSLANRPRLRFLTEFTTQTLIATVGAIIGGLAIVIIPSVVIPFLAGTLKQQTDWPLLKIADAPYFILPILLAFVFGFWKRKRFRSSAAYFLWLIPDISLISTFLSLHTMPTYSELGRWQNAWKSLFAKSCGETDCYYQYFVTAPFYTSVAYTLGWIAGWRSGPKPEIASR